MRDPVEVEAQADYRWWLANEYSGPRPADEADEPEQIGALMAEFLRGADAEADRFERATLPTLSR